MSKNIFLFISLILIISTFQLTAQNDGLLTVTKDFTNSANTGGHKAIGINPANIGLYNRDKQKATLSIMDITGTMYSEIWKRTRLHNQTIVFSTAEGSEPVSKSNLRAIDFLRDDIKANIEVEHIGISFSTKRAGSFAFNIKSNAIMGMRLNDFSKGLAFSDNDYSELVDSLINKLAQELANGSGLTSNEVLTMLDHTRIKFSVFHEFNINYSKKLFSNDNVKLHGGIGLKFILTQFDFGASVNNGVVAGYMTNMSFLPDEAQSSVVNLPTRNATKSKGTGLGIDLGFTIEIKEKYRFSLAAVSLGSMKWGVTPFTLDSTITSANTFDDYLALNNLENGIFYYKSMEDTKEKLPAKLNFGFNYELHKYVDFYFDLISPLNKNPRNIEKPIVGIGTQVSVLGWLILRTGLTFNDMRVPQTTSMPAYLSVVLGKKTAIEFGIGTADFLGIVSANRPSFSINTALMRFHF